MSAEGAVSPIVLECPAAFFSTALAPNVTIPTAAGFESLVLPLGSLTQIVVDPALPNICIQNMQPQANR